MSKNELKLTIKISFCKDKYFNQSQQEAQLRGMFTLKHPSTTPPTHLLEKKKKTQDSPRPEELKTKIDT